MAHPTTVTQQAQVACNECSTWGAVMAVPRFVGTVANAAAKPAASMIVHGLNALNNLSFAAEIWSEGVVEAALSAREEQRLRAQQKLLTYDK